jgi:hypothetical protein
MLAASFTFQVLGARETPFIRTAISCQFAILNLYPLLNEPAQEAVHHSQVCNGSIQGWRSNANLLQRLLNFDEQFQ